MILKNRNTIEGRKFWDFVERTAREVREWPPWQRMDAIYATLNLADSYAQIFQRRDFGTNKLQSEAGIYVYQKGVGKNLIITDDPEKFRKVVSQSITLKLIEAFGRLPQNEWMLVEEAAKRICQWEEWMRGCRMLIKVELPGHRHLLVFAPSDRNVIGILYCPWENEDEQQLLEEFATLKEASNSIMNHILGSS